MRPFTNHHRGFTLIEVMVVVTIIGIMAGLIAINVTTTDPQKKLNREADRFKALIEMAEEEALFGREDYGVVVKEDGYQFVHYELPPASNSQTTGSTTTTTTPTPDPQPVWAAIADADQFRAYQLPEDYQIHLEVEDQEIDPTGGKTNNNSKSSSNMDDSKYSSDDEKLIPAIYISPSGELTPFVLEIYLKDNSDVTVKISGDESGRVWIGDDDEKG